jgi:hypothetical protein
MRSILIFGFLVLNQIVYSQWSSTVTLNGLNNYTFTINDFCVVNENIVFLGVNKRETWTSPVVGTAYFTLDGGTVWDSLEFSNRYISNLESPNSTIIYFITTQLVVPESGSSYQKKILHRSSDGGNSWNESHIDSSSIGLGLSPLSFLNDSVGVVRIGTNYLITRDYGETWSPINLPVHKFSDTFFGDTILLEVQNIYTVNLSTLDLVDSFYTANCIGSLKAYDKEGTTLMRAYIAQDGPERGYPDNNYVSMSLDDYPLGNQRVLHFPYLQSMNSAYLTESNIYLISLLVPICSVDGGYNFFVQESTEPDSGDLVFMHLGFANDLVGYAVTRSSADNTYKIQKTTNSGGITNNYITPPLQFVAETNELTKNTISIYPNPSSEHVTVSSTELIDSIEMIDLFGRSIFALNNINDFKYNLDLSNFSNGNYILKVSSNSNSEFHSLIKN